MMNNTPTHKRYSKSAILEILRLRQSSTATVSEFCASHKIHKATFYNWRKRFATDYGRTVDFIPLNFSDHTSPKALFAEIEFPSNVRIILYQAVEASYFKALMI